MKSHDHAAPVTTIDLYETAARFGDAGHPVYAGQFLTAKNRPSLDALDAAVENLAEGNAGEQARFFVEMLEQAVFDLAGAIRDDLLCPDKTWCELHASYEHVEEALGALTLVLATVQQRVEDRLGEERPSAPS